MNGPVFSFGTEQFNRIFPYHILVDRDLKIQSSGSLLSGMLPLQNGQPFSNLFQLKFPRVMGLSFEHLKQITNQTAVLKFIDLDKNSYIFQGQFEYLEQPDLLLFIGIPALAGIDNDYIDEPEEEEVAPPE